MANKKRVTLKRYQIRERARQRKMLTAENRMTVRVRDMLREALPQSYGSRLRVLAAVAALEKI
jgi:hypothetical protein